MQLQEPMQSPSACPRLAAYAISNSMGRKVVLRARRQIATPDGQGRRCLKVLCPQTTKVVRSRDCDNRAGAMAARSACFCNDINTTHKKRINMTTTTNNRSHSHMKQEKQISTRLEQTRRRKLNLMHAQKDTERERERESERARESEKARGATNHKTQPASRRASERARKTKKDQQHYSTRLTIKRHNWQCRQHNYGQTYSVQPARQRCNCPRTF